MRQILAALALVLCTTTSPFAQVSVSIGINLGAYPQLVRVPGYPVYYAPQVNSNYFFYDGMYWVYAYDNWYASTWYNGPWELVAPDFVPLYILRVPVRYYRRAPVYFRGWRGDAPPRWGDHWGNTWYENHRGWDSWNRSAVPAPAPLPVYQRQYSGNRYPRADQQVTLQTQHYRYAPHDAAVQRQYQARQSMSAPTSPPAGGARAASPPPPQHQAARPPNSQQQPHPPRTDARAQSTQPSQSGTPAAERRGAPASRPPTAQPPRDAGAPPPGSGAPPRAQGQRPPAAQPMERSAAAPPARPPQPNVERAAHAANQEQRASGSSNEQRGKGPSNEQRSNGRGEPPGQDKKAD